MIGILITSLLVGATPQVAWQKAIDNQSTEKGHGSVLTPDGEAIILAGETHQDVWVYKLATADGDSVWAHVPEPSGNFRAGYDVACSPDGDLVYVGGLAAGMLSTYGYSGDGELLWSTPIGLHGVAAGPSLSCRNSDTCYLATWCLRDVTSHDAILYTLTGEGIAFSLWDSPGPHHAITGIDLDHDGNVYLSQSEFEDCRLWKRTSNGSIIWLSDFESGDKGWQCRVGPTQDIFFCGEFTVADKDFLLLKWDPEGNLLWPVGMQYDLGDDEYCRDLAVDAISDCYLAGWQARGEEEDVALVKTDSAGNMLWSWVYEQQGKQEIEAIEVDEAGYIYLAGSHHNGENWDMLVMQVRQPLTISGRITDSVGASMSGVPVKLSGDTTVEVLCDTDGFYSIEVYNGGNYVVTPDLPGWAFLPSSRTYTPLAHRELDQDFSGEWTAILESTPSTSITLEVAGGPRGVLKVSFKTPNGQVASLSVYDTSGQLIERMEVAGSGSTAIPAMPSGVYFVRLDAGFRVCTEKVVVAR